MARGDVWGGGKSEYWNWLLECSYSNQYKQQSIVLSYNGSWLVSKLFSYLWLSVQFYISFSVLFRQSYALFSGVLSVDVFSKLKQYHRYICIPFNNNSSVQSSIQHYKWFICNCSTFLSLHVPFFSSLLYQLDIFVVIFPYYNRWSLWTLGSSTYSNVFSLSNTCAHTVLYTFQHI